MRIAIHIILILLLGVGLGLTVRAIRATSGGNGPGPDDIVYTNEPTSDTDPFATEPSRPPENEDWLSRFELTERSGKIVSSDELLGQPYVLSFFFSTCPSICIKQNQKLKELQDRFEGEGVRFVAISVDPENDTPEVLREYAARFGADEDQWLFMTGDLTYIRRIGAEVYRTPVDVKFHTERFVLVDPSGEIEGFYSWPEKRQFEKLQSKIQDILSNNAAKES